ncbi:hypothetical protein [Bacteroides nordii]|uniref:hypothetical protein n=1 Tax=Bacteroides nordii TaxID=291645 RepID=UPI00399A3E23
MKKRKNKKCTTKNTHIKRFNKSREIEPEKWYDKLATWVVIAVAIALIILIALNNHIEVMIILLVFQWSGYDHCLSNSLFMVLNYQYKKVLLYVLLRWEKPNIGIIQGILRI